MVSEVAAAAASLPPAGPSPPRLAALLAGLWAGALLAIGGLAAPAGFAVAPAEIAGRIAGRMFAAEAGLGLGIAVALLLLLRAHGRARQAAGAPGSLFGTDLVLLLAAVFCTVAGYYALQPMMAAARAGQPGPSFAVLHGASAAAFGLKALLVAALAWRLTRR
ncbi:DUF4149 domain-containing protein [Piscinibacter sakaiensis]|uniref:Putative transmembrane protein n=1 Tax=Piscinibacter sakaiensis TaxID=1547922 RepID=A0A0K8NWA5_PISS1|nr:DUF4149 domain-containing protein [Piscinibacter sakaiensis]GAP34648.1 putative transmembrane protein [Piscinibacter sakaiensis]